MSEDADGDGDGDESLASRITAKTAVGRVEYADGSTNHSEDTKDPETMAGSETDHPEPLDHQPVPSESRCPYCGGDPTDRSERHHSLSVLGYLHDDIQMECEECGRTWPCGVPVGEYDGPGAEELFCDSCEQRFMRVHRVNWDPRGRRDYFIIHLKCPNPECYYFAKLQREPDGGGTALLGYPDITGSVESAKPYGYQGEGPESSAETEVESEVEEPPDCGNEDCIIHGHGTVGCPNADHGVPDSDAE